MKLHLAYSNDWSDGNEYIMGTASEVHTNALFDIYPNDTTITAEFKGNTVQNGTPSPSAPVPVVGVGYLDGAAYKIPVEIGLSTQSIDLSAVQTTRRIKKLVLTGEENWQLHSSQPNLFTLTTVVDYLHDNTMQSLCTHYKTKLVGSASTAAADDNTLSFYYYPGLSTNTIYVKDTSYSTAADFKTYLQDQYTNGTPVTIYYVLAEPTTDIVNEPLQKIGDYADSISNISLTTTAGAKSFGVDTAVKPSEITLNFRGWHPKDPKESTGGEWS